MKILRIYNRPIYLLIGIFSFLTFLSSNHIIIIEKEICRKKFIIPKIEFTDSVEGMTIVYDQLKIKDKQALIIKIFQRDVFEKESRDCFLVFQNNGKVKLIESKFSLSLKNQVFKVNLVRRKDRILYWNTLDSLVANDLIYLNQNELADHDSIPTLQKPSNTQHRFETKRACVIFIQGNKILSQCLEGLSAYPNTSRKEKEIFQFTNLYSIFENLFEQDL